MILKMILSLFISFFFAAIFGNYYIDWLKKQHAEQMIKEIGPTWHETKSGTPTMGGFIFIGGTLLSCITIGFEAMIKNNLVHIFIFLFALVFGAIGFLDDWEKIKNKRNLGLTGWVKFALQCFAALLFVFFMKQYGFVSNEVYIPFSNIYLPIPGWLYYFGSVFIIVGTVNAVNITDGIDGLATGSSIPAFIFFVAVSFLGGKKYAEIGIFSSAQRIRRKPLLNGMRYCFTLICEILCLVFIMFAMKHNYVL